MSECGILCAMDIRILRYFIAVAEEGNITKAAARLHLSQPALSTQLASLEDELGQKLFERGPRGIELTEKGLVLKRRADDLVDFAERIESEVKANGGAELEGTVSIGAGETPAFRFVARAATQLTRDNPRLRFSISSGNGEDILMHLREGVHDLALLVGRGGRALQAWVLPDSATHCCVRPVHVGAPFSPLLMGVRVSASEDQPEGDKAERRAWAQLPPDQLPPG